MVQENEKRNKCERQEAEVGHDRYTKQCPLKQENTSFRRMELGHLGQIRGHKVPLYPVSEEVLYSLSG